MKETARLHLELLKKKEENLKKTIDQLDQKIKKLEEQKEAARSSLLGITIQISRFGVSSKAKKPQTESEVPENEESTETSEISESSQSSLKPMTSY